MKILQIGIGIDNKQTACHTIKSGLLLNGHVVDNFEYRRIAKEMGNLKMNDELVERSKNYDIILIGKGEIIYSDALKKIKKQKDNIKIIYWYGDQRKNLENFVLNLLPNVDLFLHVAGGQRLLDYHTNGNCKKSMYFLIPSDISVFNGNNSIDRNIDIIFPARNYKLEGVERIEIKKYLSELKNTYLFGYNRPVITGDEYINALLKSRIGININEFMYFDKCTSNRLMHYISSGVMALSKYSPNMDLIYDGDSDIVFFDDFNDFKTKVQYYLNDNEKRMQIAKNGMKKVHEKYNSKIIMGDILNVLDNNNSIFKWTEIYEKI